MAQNPLLGSIHLDDEARSSASLAPGGQPFLLHGDTVGGAALRGELAPPWGSSRPKTRKCAFLGEGERSSPCRGVKNAPKRVLRGRLPPHGGGFAQRTLLSPLLGGHFSCLPQQLSPLFTEMPAQRQVVTGERYRGHSSDGVKRFVFKDLWLFSCLLAGVPMRSRGSSYASGSSEKWRKSLIFKGKVCGSSYA